MTVMDKYVGQTYTFEDGAASIKIIHVKLREAGYWVMYEISYNGGLGKRLLMTEQNFIGQFGYLFGVSGD